MKKLFSIILCLALVISATALLASCGGDTAAESEKAGSEEATQADTQAETEGEPEADADYKVAMITDYGDITDQSFNQTTYEACKAFSEANGIEFNYFKPAGNTTEDRVAMIESAIDNGFNVLVMPGYAFGGAIVEAAPEYPDVKFVALDVSAGDLLEAGVPAKGEEYDYNPSNWKLEDYVDMSNVYCAIYQEELCGYMAGYAAVKLGYTKLGFLGGMAVPAVIRYGYGFVQGADAAAKELDITVDINYVYGGQFYGDADITANMETWYKAGTEVVFACGGGIYTSAAEAAKKYDGKVIGVDVDQSGIIDGDYGEGITVTSAMKGLYPATYDALTDIIVNGKWDDYKGKIETLGLVSDTDPELNYVQIPMASTQWEDGKFTQDDYKTLVAAMFNGEVTVSNSIGDMPATTNANVDNQGNIK